MQVDHAIDTLVLLLQRYELDEGTEIIAEMQDACRLHARKYPRFERHANFPPMEPPDGMMPATAQGRAD
jgi:hypothetical protein